MSTISTDARQALDFARGATTHLLRAGDSYLAMLDAPRQDIGQRRELLDRSRFELAWGADDLDRARSFLESQGHWDQQLVERMRGSADAARRAADQLGRGWQPSLGDVSGGALQAKTAERHIAAMAFAR